MNFNSSTFFLALLVLFLSSKISFSMDEKKRERSSFLLEQTIIQDDSEKKAEIAKEDRGSSPGHAPSTLPTELRIFRRDSSESITEQPDPHDRSDPSTSEDPSTNEDQSTSEKVSSESDSDEFEQKPRSVPSPPSEPDSGDSDEEPRHVPSPPRASPDHLTYETKGKNGDSEEEHEGEKDRKKEKEPLGQEINNEEFSENFVSPELLGFLAGAGVIVGGYTAYTMSDTIKEKIDAGLKSLKEQAHNRLFGPVTLLWKKLQSEQLTRGDIGRFALLAGYFYLLQKANSKYGLLPLAKKIAGRCVKRASSSFQSIASLIASSIKRHKTALFMIAGVGAGALWAHNKHSSEKKHETKRSYKRFMEALSDSELCYLASAMSQEKEKE